MKYLSVWRKWSFSLIMLAGGVIMLTATGSWQEAAQPAQEIAAAFLQAKDVLTAGVTSEVLPKQDAEEEGREENTILGTLDGVETDAAGQEAVTEDVARGDADGTTDAENAGDSVVGETPDSQEVPEPVTWRDPSEVVYTTVEDDYFADAVFIGDSRTVGMFEYGGLEEISTFYASTGLTVYKMFESKIISVPGQREKITIEQALSEKQFGKIYLMIGINEMGTGNLERFVEKYKEVVEHLKEVQPDAVIYLQSIMKVSAARSAKGDYITNEGIEERNAAIAALADQVQVYYLDVNPAVCDESGGMNPEYTADGVHLKAQYILNWKDFLKQHAVVLDW